MRFYLKFISAYLKRFRFIIFSSFLLGLLIFIFTLYIFPHIRLKKTTILGYTGRYTTETLPFEFASLISRGLVSVGFNNVVNPEIATGWSMEEDGKVWIFKIDKNIKWHDKKPLNISELNYNFSDVDIVRDRDSITFTLKEPYIPFLVLLEKPIFKKGLLGTGEWKVDDMSIKGEFIQKLTISKANEKKIIRFYPTEEQTRLAFKLGEVNEIRNMTTPSPFNDWDGIGIEKITKKNQVVVIFINSQDPILSDKSLRLALNYSIDKNIFGVRATGPINPESFYFNSQVKTYNFDPLRAKELLKDIKVDLPKEYELKLISTPNLIDIADDVAAMWRDIGINSSVLVSSVIPQDYQAFITIFDIPKDPDQYSLWHSTQSQTNITKYKNLRIDKLLEDGRVEKNIEERKKIYLDFQRYLIEDSPAIFVFHPIWYNIHRK